MVSQVATEAARAVQTPTAPTRSEVNLQNGLLTINANNSTLSQVLQAVSRESGMTVNGDISNTPVFGRYGPGEPIEVLTELLTGLGYNIMMVGTSTGGAPRELLLSPRTGTVTPPQAIALKESELGPGAIAHPKPDQDDLPQMRVYQHDRRLQQMREAMEKQASSNAH